MLDSVELDDAPPFTRVERRLAEFIRQHLGGRRGANTLLVSDEYHERVFQIMARAALTAYDDLRVRRVGEVMYHPVDHPDWQVWGTEVLPDIDPDARVRRYGDNGAELDGHSVPSQPRVADPGLDEAMARIREQLTYTPPTPTRALLADDGAAAPFWGPNPSS